MSARAALDACRMALEILGDLSTEAAVKSLAAAALKQARAVLEAPSPESLRQQRFRKKPKPPSPQSNVTSRDSTLDNAGGEGGVVSSDPGDPDQEGEREREVTSGNVTHRFERYRKAYEAGITAATGRPYAMPAKTVGDLHTAIDAHSKPHRGEALEHWITKRAHAFAAFVLRLPESEHRFWSQLSPAGFLRWLNAPESAPPKPTPSGKALQERERWEREARGSGPVNVSEMVSRATAAIGRR